MAAPMDVVFSFDTTGSMSKVLDEVKCRVNDLIQRLQADIPQFKVGIIAHGDYCDKDHFYDIRTLDLTDNLPDVVNFVSETTGTGGGDIPECYELSLRHAQDMSWREGSRRVFVVIGDAYPHGPDYPQNTLNIDWQDELSSLVGKSVTIYGVQYGQDPESVSFFQRITGQSGGQHLRLQDMGDISHAIMAICYREQGADLLQSYEAEVRSDNPTTVLKEGLQKMFGKLGESDTTPADTNQFKKPHSLALQRFLSSVSSVCSTDTVILNKDGDNHLNREDTSDSISSGLSRSDQPIDVDNDLSIDDETDAADSSEADRSAKHMKRKRAEDEDSIDIGCSPIKKAKYAKGSSTSLLKKNGGPKAQKLNAKKDNMRLKRINKKINFVTKGKERQTFSRSKRESVGDKHFRFNDLPWSKWHLAAAREVPENTGFWKTVAQRGCGNTLWRTDLLRYCEKKMESVLPTDRQRELRSRTVKLQDAACVGVLFELGVISPGSREIRAKWFHATNRRKTRSVVPGVFRQPWYSGLTRPIKKQLTTAVQAGLRVFLRWAVAKDAQNVKREILAQYDYPWRS